MPHRDKGNNKSRHHTHAVKPQSIAPTSVLPPLPKVAAAPEAALTAQPKKAKAVKR